MKSTLFPAALATALLAGTLFLTGCNSDEEQAGPPSTDPPPQAPANAPKIVFLTPQEGVEVDRDYNQRVFVSIENKGPGKAALRLRSSTFEDFPSGFVGRGTPDWEVADTHLEIPAGEVWEAPLLVHANQARQNEYTLKFEALHKGVTQPAGSGELKVRVAAPELKLQTTWIEPANPVDQARLRRTLRVRNVGAAVPDLSLRFEIDGKPDPHRIFINPVVEETRLGENAAIDVVVGPHLYPSFTGLGGEMVLTGINQEHRVPYHVELPEGRSVFVTLSHTTSRSSNGGKRCTNSPGRTYNTPATNGTPDDGGGGGGGGSAHLVLTTPFDHEDGEENPPAEEEEDEGWTLFGYDEEGEGEGGEESQPDGEAGNDDEPRSADNDRESEGDDQGDEMDGENNADDGTFDHLDANSEEVIGGFIPPVANGTSIVQPPPGRPRLPDLPIPPGSGLRRSEVPGVLKKVDVVPDEVTPAGGSLRKRKESATHADEKGRKTHVTRRRTERGAEFLNFGFGIQPGVRKKVPVRLNYPISQPRLGPNPRPDAPALATYTKRNAEGTMVVETLDPETGRKVELSDPAKNADTPVSIKIGDKVETLFREGGTIKRVSLGADLAAQPADTWPAGETTGPLLAAVPAADGTLALLTREDGGKIALRLPGSVRTFTGTDASLVRQGDKLHLALRGEDGSVEILDPDADADNHTLPGKGYGPPALIRTANGGLRLYVHKPITDAEAITGGATGMALGGNFAAEFKDGAWSAPGRIYLPDSPVAAAAVAVEFTPPFASAHYKRMNTDISFNGRRLATLKEMVPAGRYLFRVPTTALHYTTSATREGTPTPPNQVVINAKGIGPGNYHLTDRCAVYALHKWTQGCFVTATAEEAERLAQKNSGDISHNAHDLVIASNGAQLPRDVKPGQKTTVTIAVFNAGDRTSPALPLTVTNEGNPAGSGTIKPLKPFRGAAAKLDIVIPPTWRPGSSLRLTVTAPSDNDADPESNSLNLFLLKEYQPRLAGPTAPTRVEIASIPKEAITEVVVPDNGEPFEAPLQVGRAWFRTEVPPTGDLQLEVHGSGADLVDRIDLFDQEGKALRTDQGATPVPESHLFIRVGLPPQSVVPADTRLRVWWE